MIFDLIIKRGCLVTPSGRRVADVGIKGERIVKIGKIGGQSARHKKTRILDARGRYILPGVIDPHVHFGLEAYRSRTADDFRQGTMAAASGGVTTVIDYAIPEPGETLVHAVRKKKKEASGKAVVDYSFHAQIIQWNDRTAGEIRELVKSGITSFKVFMPLTEGWMVDDAGLYHILREVGASGGIVEVHAENGPLIRGFIKELVKEKRLSVKYFPLSRPNLVEEEAVQRAVTLARAARSRLYIVHLTTGEGLRAVTEARSRGVKVYAETCPQYLVLENSCFSRPDAYRYLACPPIKSLKDRDALWNGIRDGSINCIGTDHCSFNSREKKSAGNDFRKGPYGLPGVENSLSLMFTEGYRKRRISLSRLVEITSYNPARLFGLYPRKGVLAPGSDADIVIFNPEKRVTVDYKKLRTACDWSPYQSRKLRGYPETTISRGEIIVEDGKLLGKPGRGKFLSRGSAVRDFKDDYSKG